MSKQQVVFKQKEILANFYANFALLWFSFGIISPLYNLIKDMIRLISGIVLAVLSII